MRTPSCILSCRPSRLAEVRFASQARTDTETYRLRRDAYQRLIVNYPSFKEWLESVTKLRLQKSTSDQEAPKSNGKNVHELIKTEEAKAVAARRTSSDCSIPRNQACEKAFAGRMQLARMGSMRDMSNYLGGSIRDSGRDSRRSSLTPVGECPTRGPGALKPGSVLTPGRAMRGRAMRMANFATKLTEEFSLPKRASRMRNSAGDGNSGSDKSQRRTACEFSERAKNRQSRGGGFGSGRSSKVAPRIDDDSEGSSRDPSFNRLQGSSRDPSFNQ